MPCELGVVLTFCRRGQDVIGTLESIAEKFPKTGFFHNGDSNFNSPQIQTVLQGQIA